MRPCIQIHIPRTAGTSVTHALDLKKMYNPEDYPGLEEEHQPLGNFSLGHILFSTIPMYGYVSYGSYFCFSIVRNPYDRMVSLFRLFNKRVSTGGNFLTFCESVYFLRREDQIEPVGFYNFKGLSQLNSQVEWLWDGDGRALVHHLLRYESLQEDFNMLCRLLEIEPIELPHVHKTQNQKDRLLLYQDFPECIDLVYKIYKEDFLVLGYKS